MNSTQYFAVFLCVFGLAMVVWHVLERAALHRREASDEERQFGRRRFIRRMQASLSIFILGAAILAADLVPDEGTSAMLYWSTIMLVVLWIGILALADLMAIQEYYRLQQAALHRERKELEAEAHRLSQAAGPRNGAAPAGAAPAEPPT